MTIQLAPELEAAVTHEAQRLGTTPEMVVQRAVQDHLRAHAAPVSLDRSAPQEKLRRILAVARDCGVSLSNEALSSEGLYD